MHQRVGQRWAAVAMCVLTAWLAACGGGECARASGGGPDPQQFRTTRQGTAMDVVQAVAAMGSGSRQPEHCGETDVVSTAPMAPIAPAPAYRCTSASGMEDVVRAEDEMQAVRVCQALDGEACRCVRAPTATGP